MSPSSKLIDNLPSKLLLAVDVLGIKKTHTALCQALGKRSRTDSSKGAILNFLYTVVDEIGADQTDAALNKAMASEFKFEDACIQFVVNTVCGKMDVSVHELLYGVGRKNERKLTIGFCFFYLTKHYKFQHEKVAVELKKDSSLGYKYASMVHELNHQHIYDRKYIDIRTQLDDIFSKDLQRKPNNNNIK